MILITIQLALITLTILGFSKKLWWFSILDFFRLQYALASATIAIIAIFNANFIALCLGIVCFGVNIWRIRKFLPRYAAKRTHRDKQILSVNAYKNNFNPERLNTIIEETAPEILLIMEMTSDLKAGISEALEDYEHKLETSVRDGFKITLFSKTPLENAKVTEHGPNNTPLMHAVANINGKPHQLYCAHPKPPLNKNWHEERHIYFKEIEKIIADTSLPILVMGDFNSVPWEKHFSTFLNNTSLKSTLEGYGYQMTWPVFFPIFGIPMDHILINREHKYSEVYVGPYAASDHYPITLNL